MRCELDMDYSVERMEQSRRRMEAGAESEYVKRVPVGFCPVLGCVGPRAYARTYAGLFLNVYG